MTTKTEDIWKFFTSEEKNVLEKIGIEMTFQGMKFVNTPSWEDFTTTFIQLWKLESRVMEKDKIGFVIGDCLNQANVVFGEEKVDHWVQNFIEVVRLRDISLNMAGGLLILLQQVEHIVKGCFAFADIKDINIEPNDLFSTNKKKRFYTLGTLGNAIKKTKTFDNDFEARLTKFVKDRNNFIHQFWIQSISSKEVEGNIPNKKDYKKVLNFLSHLSQEALYLERVFKGLLFSMLYSYGQAKWPEKIEESSLIHWEKYLQYFKDNLRNEE